MLIVVGALVVLELTYFQFHTYFRRTEVQEVLPTATPGPARSPGAQVTPVPTPRTIAQGQFGVVDAIHKGSGTARIVEQNGTRYLYLENFEVTSGPDLYVYLSDGEALARSVEDLGTYADLGPLKATAGNQVYEIPAGAPQGAAVIWCKRFGVLFTYAVMR